MTRCVCATHGHCFDGLASATIFSELLAHISPETTVEYRGCGYGPGHVLPPFDGDHNVILDYRYQDDDRLTFYFDHHATAFGTKENRLHFEGREKLEPTRFVWDPASVSCAGLIARNASLVHGINLDKHAHLIRWADTIDGARFPSAEAATDRSEPVLRLAAVVERFGDDAFLARSVGVLRTEGLEALASSRFVKDRYRGLAPSFKTYERRVQAQGRLQGRIALVDLTSAPVDVVAKFAQYRFFPEATYSFVVTTMPSAVKISIGYNPWCGQPLDINIGALCARHGGGGHPVVGAISLPLDRKAEALHLAARLAEEMQTPESSSINSLDLP